MMKDAKLTDRRVWTTAIVVSAVLALIGLLVASMTTADVFKGRTPARTIWGVMVIVTGLFSPSFIGLLVAFRSHFARLHRSSQFLWICTITCCYLIALVILMLGGWYSSTIVLPLPVVPTLSLGLDDEAVLRIDLERDRFGWSGGTTSPADPYYAFGEHVRTFEGDWRAASSPGLSWSILKLVPRKYHPNHPGQMIAELTGTITSTSTEQVNMSVDLTVAEIIELQVHGLENVEIACTSTESFDATRIEAGRYQIAITGQASRRNISKAASPR